MDVWPPLFRLDQITCLGVAVEAAAGMERLERALDLAPVAGLSMMFIAASPRLATLGTSDYSVQHSLLSFRPSDAGRSASIGVLARVFGTL
jgi:hypothetical protein